MSANGVPNCRADNSQTEKPKDGSRTQDQVLKDLAELKSISSAAQAGLLSSDAVLRIDDEKDTPGQDPSPLSLELEETDLTVATLAAASKDNEQKADPPLSKSPPPHSRSLVITRAQALRKSNLTFIIKPTTQYYYKCAPSASPEEQRDQMKAYAISSLNIVCFYL